jgi:hypothetical protein
MAWNDQERDSSMSARLRGRDRFPRHMPPVLDPEPLKSCFLKTLREHDDQVLQWYPGDVVGEIGRPLNYFKGIADDDIWWSDAQVQVFQMREEASDQRFSTTLRVAQDKPLEKQPAPEPPVEYHVQWYPGDVVGEIPRKNELFEGIDDDVLWWSQEAIESFKERETSQENSSINKFDALEDNMEELDAQSPEWEDLNPEENASEVVTHQNVAWARPEQPVDGVQQPYEKFSNPAKEESPEHEMNLVAMGRLTENYDDLQESVDSLGFFQDSTSENALSPVPQAQGTHSPVPLTQETLSPAPQTRGALSPDPPTRASTHVVKPSPERELHRQQTPQRKVQRTYLEDTGVSVLTIAERDALALAARKDLEETKVQKREALKIEELDAPAKKEEPQRPYLEDVEQTSSQKVTLRRTRQTTGDLQRGYLEDIPEDTSETSGQKEARRSYLEDSADELSVGFDVIRSPMKQERPTLERQYLEDSPPKLSVEKKVAQELETLRSPQKGRRLVQPRSIQDDDMSVGTKGMASRLGRSPYPNDRQPPKPDLRQLDLPYQDDDWGSSRGGDDFQSRYKNGPPRPDSGQPQRPYPDDFSDSYLDRSENNGGGSQGNLDYPRSDYQRKGRPGQRPYPRDYPDDVSEISSNTGWSRLRPPQPALRQPQRPYPDVFSDSDLDKSASNGWGSQRDLDYDPREYPDSQRPPQQSLRSFPDDMSEISSNTGFRDGRRPQGYPPMDARSVQGYPPMDARSVQGYPPRDAQSVQGYPPRDAQSVQGYPPRDAQNVQGYPPRDAQSVQGYPPRDSQSVQGYPPRDSQSVQGYPPRDAQSVQGYPRRDAHSVHSYPPRVQAYPLMDAHSVHGYPPGAAPGVPGYPPMDARSVQGYPPMDVRSVQGYPPGAAPGVPGYSPIDARSVQAYPPRDSQSVQGYPPRDAQSVQGYPPRDAQSVQGYPPRDTQSVQGYPPRHIQNQPSQLRGPNPFDRRFWRPPVSGLSSNLKGSMNARNYRLRNINVNWDRGDVGQVFPPDDRYVDLSDDEIWFSKRELQQRRISDVQELQQQRDAQMFDKECEEVYECIFEKVELFYGDRHRENTTTYGAFAMSTLELRNLLSPNIMMGLSYGYRGLELGGLKGRRERTVVVAGAVREYLSDTANQKKKAARRQRLNFAEGLALAVEKVSVTDRIWSQLTALGDLIIENSS